MVANTGTYLDAPFHRYAEGGPGRLRWRRSPIFPPSSCAGRGRTASRRRRQFEGLDVRGKAVLVHTGWDRHWRTDRYGVDHPYLTADAAGWLVEHGAALVGIDSNNIDDTRVRARPVHTRLLGAGIPICEHMTGLGRLPDNGFRFPRCRRKSRHGHLPGPRLRCFELMEAVAGGSNAFQLNVASMILPPM